MKIINKVEAVNYIQWIEQFINQIIQRSKISCQEIVIEDIEDSKRIYLNIDGQACMVRTWNFQPIKKDEQGQTCAENVKYTLFRTVEDETGSHGEEVNNGSLKIEWNN